MYRDFFTNKWIIGSIVFLVITSVSCVLWYRHVTNSYDQDLAEAKSMVERYKKIQKKYGRNTIQSEQMIKSDTDSNFNDVSLIKDKDVKDNITEQYRQVNQVRNPTFPQEMPKEDSVIDLPISPFGYGSFPKLPSDYPYLENWDYYANKGRLTPPDDWSPSPLNLSWEETARKSELIARVRVKLWEKGIDAIGAVMNPISGLIYPSVEGVAYIEYDMETEFNRKPDGTTVRVNSGRKYISNISGNINSDEASQILDGKTPLGVNVYVMPDGGIDPYSFLNLQK